jgi:hypothetical protein
MKTINRLLLTLSLLPAVCFAQTMPVKPGLWEHSVELKSESGKLENMLETARAQIALMPPAQRQMMENMMAQQGLKLDLANQSFQNCITEEDASDGEFAFSEDSGCEKSDSRSDGSTTHISFVCKQGQGELAFKDGSEYSGTSTMTMKLDGADERVTSTHMGRWLGASCAGLE